MSIFTTLKFFVTENGNKFPISQMSEPESYAIQRCVEQLLPNHTDDYWLEVDTCIFITDGEEEPEYGLVRGFTANPNPKNGSQAESKIPHPIPLDIVKSLQGKTFHVSPTQYGLNPWSFTVEIRFEDVGLLGIKASELIAAALRTQ